MFCTNCGANMPDDAKFCTVCGSSAEPKPGPSAPPPAPAPKKVKQKAPKPPREEGPKKKSGMIWLVVLLAVVAAVAVAVAIWATLPRFMGGEEVDGSSRRGEDSSQAADDRDSGDGSSPHRGEPQPLQLQIRQVDNSAFPKITFYSSVLDENDQVVEGLTARDFVLRELVGGVAREQTLTDVRRVQGEEKCSVSLVLDASGSMDGSRIAQAKQAALSFLGQVNFGGGDRIGVISFSDYVYLEQDFVSDPAALNAAINGIALGDMTALYDAVYSALVQTYEQDGARCVIAFTDGQENASSYTFDDVVELSRSSGIPVYLIGIGSGGEYDESALRSLAEQCSGAFYPAGGSDLDTVLADIYTSIYRQQQDYYVFRYTSSNPDVQAAERGLELALSDRSDYTGADSHDFRTQAVINEGFSSDFRNRDYILPSSSYAAITDADLSGLSLAQLRIARNEIYARHGRQFKDAWLNQWFYSKNWYLSVYPKYAPAAFDAMPTPLSSLEQGNVHTISQYEKAIMDSRDIYPNAGSVPLTEYDLALSKSVLQRALDQMSTYPSTPTLQVNLAQVREALNKAEIQY